MSAHGPRVHEQRSENDVHRSRPGRPLLWGAVWAVFLSLWALACYIVLAWTVTVFCGGDGGLPYAAPASDRGRYCSVANPSDQVGVSVVALAVFVALVLIGIAAIRKRRPWLLVPAVALGVAVLAVHLTLLSTLSRDCTPRDPTNPSCAHY